MPSKARLLAKSMIESPILSEITSNPSVTPATIASAVDEASVGDFASPDLLPNTGNEIGDQAFVQSSNRLYIWNGSGWYNIALINTTPTWDSGGQPLSSYVLDADSPQDATIITLAASDPDGLPISYSYVTAGSMDSMATISQDSSVFTITPKTVSEVGEGAELTGSITFRASDGVNILPSVSSFTLRFITIIENSRYTTLLATATGTSDNNNITDESTSNHTITVNGDTHAGTFSPYRHGGYSNHFDGSGDFLAIPNDAGFGFGTGSWTFETWLYCTKTGATNAIFDTRVGTGTQTGSFGIGMLSTGQVQMFSGGVLHKPSDTLSFNEWQHLAIVKDASTNTTTFYYNGTASSSTYSDTRDYGSSQPVQIAKDDWTNYFGGYLRDLRVVKGTAVYSGNFTPPTERLTAVTNTSLLTCHLPYISDGSSNGHSITINGNTSTKPIGPYNNFEYSADAHGGSVNMPNDNDYLYVSHSSTLKPSGTDPFCVSFWYYPTTSPGTTRQLVGDANYVSYPTNCPGWDILYQSGSQLDVRWGYPNYADMASGKTNSTVQVNAWNHIAFCRSGGSLSYYLNGKRCNTTTSNINISASGLANFYVGYAGESTGTAMNSAMGTIADFKYEVGTSQFDATASTITIPTAPQSTTNSVLHIKGSDVSFIDKSQGANIGLIGPGTGTSTESPFAGGKSLDLTSTTETYVYVDGDSIVINANEAFTFEFWMKYVGQRGGSGTCIFDWGIHSGDGNVALFRQNTGGYKLHITGFGGFSNYSTAYDSLEDGTWKHFALSRTSSGDVKSFIDGSVIESSTGYTLSVADRADTAKKLRIGGLHNYNAYGIKMYIQDAKITRGLAKYTANFTPPTESFKA